MYDWTFKTIQPHTRFILATKYWIFNFVPCLLGIQASSFFYVNFKVNKDFLKKNYGERGLEFDRNQMKFSNNWEIVT